MKNLKFKLNYFSKQPLIKKLFFLFPLIYISGPFLTDFSILVIDVLFLIYLKNNFDSKIIHKIKIIFIPLIIFWIVALINSLLNFNNYEQIIKSLFFVRFIIFSLFVYYYSHQNFQRIDLVYLKNFTITSIMIVALSVYIEFFYHYFLEQKINDRYSGIFFSEEIAGSILLKLLSFYFLTKFILKSYLDKYDLILIFFILPLMIIINERISFILFLFLIFFLLFFYLKLSLIKKFFVFTLSILVIFLLISKNEKSLNRYSQLVSYTYIEAYKKIFNSSPNLPNFLKSEANQEIVSGYDYFELIYSGIEVGLTKPLFGVGFRNFRNICPKIKDIKNCNIHPHNYYSEIFAENGIVGLSLILLSFYFFINYMISNSINYGLIIFLINFWPLVTTGSFFNNYIGAFNALIIGSILLKKQIKS